MPVGVTLGACAEGGNDASGSRADSGDDDAGGFEGSPIEMADELAAAFFRDGVSLPSYTFVESQTMSMDEIPPDVAAAGARAGAVLGFEGATAMDPAAFRYLGASFLVFEPPSAATAFYELYQTNARSQSEIAVQEIELQGDGIPTQSPSHNMADPRYQNCTTCHLRIHGSNADRRFLR